MKNANADHTVPLDRSIVLVGMMGAGKSAVGRQLAQRLGLPFADADHEIERAADCSIADIFAQFGEEYFRAGAPGRRRGARGDGLQALRPGVVGARGRVERRGGLRPGAAARRGRGQDQPAPLHALSAGRPRPNGSVLRGASPIAIACQSSA